MHLTVTTNFKEMKIYGLEKYEIRKIELKTIHSESVFDIKILINYFQDLDILRPLNPKERRLFIRQKSRENLKTLLKDYPSEKYTLIGTKIKPRGILGQLTGKQILELQNNSGIDQIIIKKAGELKPQKEEQYFSVQGLFAIIVEGFDYTDSIRFTEERIILVKALDSETAIQKANIEFKKYSDFEYLNSDFRITRWDFIEIMDVYEVDETEIDPNGTEIFSVTRNRKLK